MAFTLGDAAGALAKLDEAERQGEEDAQLWLARAEILLAEGHLEEAVVAGERALRLSEEDIHINTTLSRIWVALGNKEKAEYYGGQAKILSWKGEIHKTLDN